MHMLYDSDTFVVVHMHPDAPLDGQVSAVVAPTPLDADGAAATTNADNNTVQSAEAKQPPQHRLTRQGFEIVDKRTGKEVYLDGSWAEMFQLQVLEWQRNTPTQEEVEAALDRYAGLAQNPVVVH